MRAAPILVSISAVAGGCARESAPQLCPDLAVGELVVSEIHGTPSPDDGSKEWIELFSPGGTDVEGLRVRFRRLDGSSEIDVLVRRSVPVAAGGYVVLGLDDDAALQPYIDYGFQSDFQQGWLSAAAIDIESCGVRIDRAQYSSLPKVGTFSLGTMPPDATANDNAAAWCDDPSATGTPRAANIACP